MRQTEYRTGFTLIELLVSISIIVLMVSILLPTLSMAREASRNAVCMAHMRNFGVGMAAYAAESNDYLAGPNTSGTTIGNHGLAASSRATASVGATRPLQNFDWISPTVGDRLGLSHDPATRLRQILNEELRCPTNEMRYGGQFSGSPSWALPGNPRQFYVMSYAANYAFHMRKTGRFGDEPPGGTDPDSTSGSWNASAQNWGTEVGLDMGPTPGSHSYRLSHIRNASIKAYVVEGIRYMAQRTNPTSEPTYNGMYAERQGGNFMHAGFLYNGSGGNPYGWGPTGTSSTNSMGAGTLETSLAYGSRLNGFRHANTSMNLLMFDGSGQNARVAEAVKIEHHLPSGTTVAGAATTADPSDSNGQVVR